MAFLYQKDTGKTREVINYASGNFGKEIATMHPIEMYLREAHIIPEKLVE